MDEFVRKSDLLNSLDDLCDRICVYTKKQRWVMCGSCPLGEAFDVVEDHPSADVAPVVRCLECKHYVEKNLGDSCSLTHKYFPPSGFCSWGKRRLDNCL